MCTCYMYVKYRVKQTCRDNQLRSIHLDLHRRDVLATLAPATAALAARRRRPLLSLAHTAPAGRQSSEPCHDGSGGGEASSRHRHRTRIVARGAMQRGGGEGSKHKAYANRRVDG